MKLPTKKTIAVFRVDSSPSIGAGHWMRCLSLAAEFKKIGVHPVFLTKSRAAGDRAKTQSPGISLCYIRSQAGGLRDAQETVTFAKKINASCIVIDGYQFNDLFLKDIAKSGLTTAIIDDFGSLKSYCADLVVNQNMHAYPSLYKKKCCRTTRFLLGPSYALLRGEFLKNRKGRRRFGTTAKNVLVTLGSSDPQNVTMKVLRAFLAPSLACCKIKLVIGGNNVHKGSLLHFIKRSKIDVDSYFNVKKMAPLMEWADIAILAGGTTGLELAHMGVPALMIVLASNQFLVARDCHRAGIAINLGWHDKLTPSRVSGAIVKLMRSISLRKSMSQRGNCLIDGKGAARVAKELADLCFEFRPAKILDLRRIYQWANDPVTRKASFCSEKIRWQEHCDWFKKLLNDSDRLLWIAYSKGHAVGQIRFEKKGREAVISLALDPAFRHQGLGSRLIRLATLRFLYKNPIQRISAWIKADNVRSIAAFQNAGYRLLSKVSVQGHPAVCMRYAL